MTRAASRAAAESPAKDGDSGATQVAQQSPTEDRGPTKRKKVTFKEPPKGRGRGKAAKGADPDDRLGSIGVMQVSYSFAPAIPPPISLYRWALRTRCLTGLERAFRWSLSELGLTCRTPDNIPMDFTSTVVDCSNNLE